MSILHTVVSQTYRTLTGMLPPAVRLSIDFYRGNGYWPDLKVPSTFNEKVIYRKLHWTDSTFATFADKLAVREHVAACVGTHVLADLYAVFDTAEQITLTDLPKRFVMKCTHDSGSVLVISDKHSASLEEIQDYFRRRLARKPSVRTYTQWYWNVPAKVIVEEHLGSLNGTAPADYKFFVFDGVTRMIQVDTNRFSEHTRNLYTRSWKPIDGQFKYPTGQAVNRPTHLGDMLQVAETLGRDIDFVRVDLYTLPERPVVFGELTMGPDSGYGRFEPREIDHWLGGHWFIK